MLWFLSEGEPDILCTEQGPVSNGPLILELICLTEEFFKCGYIDCLSIHQPTYLPSVQRSRLKSSRLAKTDSVKSAMPGRIETLFLAALFCT